MIVLLRARGIVLLGHRGVSRYLRRPRFGTIAKKDSIALIERLWKTLKDSLDLRLLRPSVAEDLMQKIELGLIHYALLPEWGAARPRMQGGRLGAGQIIGAEPCVATDCRAAMEIAKRA